MYYGYISINGEEFANAARALVYSKIAPSVPLKDCWDTADSFPAAIGHEPYTTPEDDNAPWFSDAHSRSYQFYGVFPLEVAGFMDSTWKVATTETVRGGAAAHTGRFGPRSIRLRMLAMAGSSAGMEAGFAWVKDMFVPEGCGSGGALCPQFSMQMYTQCPTNTTQEQVWLRNIIGIEVVDGIKIIRDTRTNSGAYLREFDVSLTVTTPGVFTTNPTMVTSSGKTETSGNGEVYCPPRSGGYDTLVFDPAATPEAPPRPPGIHGMMPTTWTRRSILMMAGYQESPIWGRITPLIEIATTVTRRSVRVRIYRDLNESAGVDVGACEWESEFYVTYMPANSTLTIDCRTRTCTIFQAGGVATPADHLVMGSNGRPPVWAELDCDGSYTVRVEMASAQSGTTVELRPFVRE